jgi:3-methyladenine DNA glycosylase AlkC
MELITKNIDKEVKEQIIKPSEEKDFATASQNTIDVQDKIYRNIPDDKRSSYGVVHTIRILSRCIAKHLSDKKENLLNIGTGIYSKSNNDTGKGVALGILAEYGKEDFANTSPFFISAALSDNWQLREFAQMFFRKLITAKPDESKELLIETVKATDPKLRRFVSESLRPIKENSWIMKEPKYSLDIIKHLFKEQQEYPRKSVANNLSDLSKENSETIFSVIKVLAEMGDPNAYRIAYRASRNLVKKHPIRVMDILQIDEYSYKDKKYSRSDFS